MRHGVGCADNQHCCPHHAPVCDTDKGVCTSEDGQKTVPWTTKVPASYSDAPKPLPEEQQQEGGSSFEGDEAIEYMDYANTEEAEDLADNVVEDQPQGMAVV